MPPQDPNQTVTTPPQVSSQHIAMQTPVWPVGATPKPSRLRSWLQALGLAILAALLFIGGIYCHIGITQVAQAHATQVAQNFIAALNQGDATTAYTLASDHLRQRRSVGEFSGAMGDLQATKPKVLSSSTTFNGKIANFTELEDGLPPNGDGHTTAQWTITLVKSGLWSWQVDGVDVQ